MKYTILPNRAIIKIGGPDCFKFLNSITTNKIESSSITYSLMLSPQGRYMADFFLYPEIDQFGEQFFLLETHSLAKERLLELFSKYKLRSKILIQDLSANDLPNYVCIYSEQQIHSATSFKDPRHKQLGFRSLLSTQADGALAGMLLDNDLYNIDKYHLCISEGESEMVAEKSFPQEYGLDKLNAISYSKGCYIGQEVVARVKYQGVVRKKIYHLTAKDPASIIQSGAKIVYCEQEVGFICSSWRNQAIGLLKLEASGPIECASGELVFVARLADYS